MDDKQTYQWSIKLNNGEIYVVHASTFDILKERVRAVREAIGTTQETEKEDKQPPKKTVKRDSSCEKCGNNNFWVNVVKKESPNKGKEFYICTECKAFNGFLS